MPINSSFGYAKRKVAAVGSLHDLVLYGSLYVCYFLLCPTRIMLLIYLYFFMLCNILYDISLSLYTSLEFFIDILRAIGRPSVTRQCRSDRFSNRSGIASCILGPITSVPIHNMITFESLDDKAE
jgi:hypothetical protein